MASKHKRIALLSGGLFDKPFMDSKVKTRSVTKKELILGHLIGPLGLIFVVNTIWRNSSPSKLERCTERKMSL